MVIVMSRTARISLFIALGIALFPLVTFAADVSNISGTLTTGFATTPLWVSKASPIDGDALKLFAVVNDISSTTVSGTVSFFVDGTDAGSVKVSLDAGTAQIVGVAWTAVAGTHTITATFLETTAGPITITVADAPPKPVALQYLDTAMNAASPALSGALTAIDNARQSGADYFANQLGLGATSTAPRGQVLGASTNNLANAGAVAVTAVTSSPSWFSRLAYLFFNNPLVFYPILILSIIFALWLISRIFSRR